MCIYFTLVNRVYRIGQPVISTFLNYASESVKRIFSDLAPAPGARSLDLLIDGRYRLDLEV
jgi:hypothetical protein